MPRKIPASRSGGIEVRDWARAQAIALPAHAGNQTFQAIQKCIGQEAHEAVHAIFILVLALATMLLDLGMIGQGIQAVEFGLIGLGVQRLAIECDQASNSSILGFDNVLGVAA